MTPSDQEKMGRVSDLQPAIKATLDQTEDAIAAIKLAQEEYLEALEEFAVEEFEPQTYKVSERLAVEIDLNWLLLEDPRDGEVVQLFDFEAEQLLQILTTWVNCRRGEEPEPEQPDKTIA
jgi:hypothetical protein